MIGSAVIGLDVGTQAVRAAELSLGRGRPVLRRLGQIGLPPGAVVAGEVVDAPAVSAALRRLWKEAGFGSRDVVVGVANNRVVARVADLPAMPENELRSSLRWQVQDLIPLPLEDAELDASIIERPVLEAAPDARVRTLLVAAHRDMLRSLLAALEGASLRATRIDLVPFALVRALTPGEGWLEHDGYDVIVGSGAGVTNVVVHDRGIPQFVRTIPTGGAAVTEALAGDLGIEPASAEALKRGAAGGVPTVARAEAAATAALVPLAGEVAGSLDYHLAQIERGSLRRVVLSGGGARLDAFRRVLEDHLSVEVVDGDPFARLDVSKAPLRADELAGARDLFATAVGLALAEGDPHAVSLLPAEVRTQRAERRQMALAGTGVAAFAALLVALAYARGTQVDDMRTDAARAEARTKTLQSQVASLQDMEQLQSDIAAGRQTALAALEGDVDWPALFRGIGALIPEDVWLTSFYATRGAAGQGTTLQFSARGFDQTSAARWLLRLQELDSVSDAWLTTSSKAQTTSGRSVVDFTSNAVLGSGGPSRRAERFSGGAG